jgi:5-methylcytosine-specific restriction endonuclease McrA
VPLAHLCPGCGRIHGRQGRCSECKRLDERNRLSTEPIRRLRASPRWRRVRRLIRRGDGDQCVTCGATHGLEVHHIAALVDGGDPFTLDNLITLCHSCHTKQHFLGVGAGLPHASRPRVSAVGAENGSHGGQAG